ncbi:sarcosine oxidase subunit delta [soil metagenome]
MLRIACPICGPRAQAEFVFDRALDAILALDSTPEEAVKRLYARDNPRGWSWELWRHGAGCGAWLKLHRHSATHEIAVVEALPGLE